jgi:hypothetical protein
MTHVDSLFVPVADGRWLPTDFAIRESNGTGLAQSLLVESR